MLSEQPKCLHYIEGKIYFKKHIYKWYTGTPTILGIYDHPPAALLVFTHDAKRMKHVKEISDCNDPDKICEWSHKWKLNFKGSTCALIRFFL